MQYSSYKIVIGVGFHNVCQIICISWGVEEIKYARCKSPTDVVVYSAHSFTTVLILFLPWSMLCKVIPYS